MADGDIGSVQDTLEFDPVYSNYSRILRVSDTIAVIFYGETGSDQRVVSVEVNAAGQITNAIIDGLTWNGNWFGYGSICKRADNLFVCSYRGSLDHVNIYGHLSTITCGNDGAIPAATLDNAVLDTSQILWTSIIYLAGNVVVVAFTDEGNDGVLKTFLVSAAGAITEPAEDTFEFDGAVGNYPHLCKISNSKIAVVYTDSAGDGQLFTIGIDAAGNIDGAKIDTYEFDVNQALTPRICHVTGNIYAIAYTGWGTVGYLRTVEIASDGQITEPFKDTWTTGAVEGNEPAIIKVSDSIVAGVYYDTANDGQLFTIGIDAAGNIDAAPIDTLEYETDTAYYNDLCFMAGNIYLICFQGPGTDGFVKSVDIETPLLARPHHEMTMGIGP